MRRSLALVSLVAGLLAPPGCRTPTQIEVVITSDLPCDRVQSVSITAGPRETLEGPDIQTATADCRDVTGGSEIGNIVVAPAGEKDVEVGIRVVGGVDGKRAEDCGPPAYPGCIVARRLLRYVPHTELRLEVALSEACLDVPCSPVQTCVKGVCKDATIEDPSKCQGDGCGEEELGGGGPGGGGGSGGGPALPSFALLDLPAGAQEAYLDAVSDDGRVVAGRAVFASMSRAYVWIREPSLMAVSLVPLDSSPVALDAPGNLLVGHVVQGRTAKPAYWSASDGFAAPVFGEFEMNYKYAHDVDAAGSRILVSTETGEFALWDSYGGTISSTATGIPRAFAKDGSRVAGQDPSNVPSFWPVNGDGVLLPAVEVGLAGDQAIDIGPDGNVLLLTDGPTLQPVLYDIGANTRVPFATGIDTPKALTGTTVANSVVVGQCGPAPKVACVWEAAGSGASFDGAGLSQWPRAAGASFDLGVVLDDAVAIGETATDLVIGGNATLGGVSRIWTLRVPKAP